MNRQYLRMINEIEAEIKIEYIGGAIRWADENFDHAWSKAMSRFDLALVQAGSRSEDFIISEASLYKRAVLNLVAKYKKEKNIDEAKSFLSAIAIDQPREERRQG